MLDPVSEKTFFFLFAIPTFELALTRTSESLPHRNVFICKSLKDATQQSGIIPSKITNCLFYFTNDLLELVRRLRARLPQKLSGVTTFKTVIKHSLMNGPITKP